jgi:hypothetical protein
MKKITGGRKFKDNRLTERAESRYLYKKGYGIQSAKNRRKFFRL